MPSSHLAFTLSHSTAADILLWRGRCDGRPSVRWIVGVVYGTALNTSEVLFNIFTISFPYSVC